MLGDIQIFDEPAFGYPGDREYAVAFTGTAATIKAGEPVSVALGATNVTVMTTSKPVVATDFLAGISATTSTETTTANGIVRVMKLVPGMSYLISPKVAATWNTQTKYNDIIGDRVTLDLTTGTYTINSTDGATNGCVILPLDIAKFPGKVRFAFRNGVDYLT